MKYIIIGSLTSPYVRKIRLLLHTHPYELKLINYLDEVGNEYLKSINPVNKLPALIDGNNTVLDSRVIYNYLSKKYSWPTLTLNEENILTAIDGALDSLIALFMLRRGGMDITLNEENSHPNNYIDRQIKRVPDILNYLKPWVLSLDSKNPDHWNFLTMSLYSFIDWAKLRGMLDFENYPELTEFLNDFKNAPGVFETTPT